MYRQHNNPDRFLQYFEESVEKYSATGKQLCILGDYNLDLLKTENSKYSHDFLMCLQSCYLIQTIEFSTNNSSLRAPSYPKPIFARFSHYQDKDYVRSLRKKLKGTSIGFSDDFPKEIEEIRRKLYKVLKKAQQDKQKAFFNFDKLIINGQIYRGKEIKDLLYYCKMAKKLLML